jgi:RNA polymerase sigma factor (sigma-70 family)
MPSNSLPSVLHDALSCACQSFHYRNDAELLEAFAADGDESAFAEVVRRHGRLVLGVSRRMIGDPGAAEDVFQATFLLLAQKAASIAWGPTVAPWLYQAARRIAGRERARAGRSSMTPITADVPAPPADPAANLAWAEVRAALDDALASLPSRLREPLVLCYLEGFTQDEAAAALACSATTVKGRVTRGRERLRRILAKRGLLLSAALAAPLVAGPAVAVEMAGGTARAAAVFRATGAAPPAIRGLLSATSLWWKLPAALVGLIIICMTGIVGLAPMAVKAPGTGANAAAPAGADTDPSEPPLFEDISSSSGVAFTYRNGEEANQLTILESLGGGVAFIDYDGDGLLDILLPGGGTFTGKDKKEIAGAPCKLYRNLGGGKFKDVTAEVGLDKLAGGKPWFYTHGAAVADFDRDGWPDLLVTGWGRVALFRNVDGKRFEDITAKAGLDKGITWATSAAWGDLDGDGYPDLYICQYVDWSWKKHPACSYDGGKTADICPPKNFNGLPHMLFRNNGDGTFTDVSRVAGLHPGGGQNSKGLGVVMIDINGDGKPDIYAANDEVSKLLYINRSIPGKIQLVEQGVLSGCALDDRGSANGSSGVDAGDYDGSGKPALWVTNYENEQHGLYRNDCKAGLVAFTFQTPAAGLTAMGQNFVGWGTSFLDVDLDGWESLFIANGHAIRYPKSEGVTRKQRPVLMRNVGGKFKDISRQIGSYYEKDHLARGVAFGDLDSDGRIDLVIIHVNDPVTVLRGIGGKGHHWLGVQLVGKNNADVVGAKVQLQVGDRTLTRFAKGGGSYLSSADRRIVLGLGTKTKVGRLTVTWPDGRKQTFDALPIDRYHVIVQGEAKARAYPMKRK